jgi:hypothetical protein
LTPASGRQDHTTSPSAPSAARLAPPPRPPHSNPTFVTIAKRPSSRGGMARSCKDDLPDRLSGKFFRTGLDRFLSICPSGQINPLPIAAPIADSPLRRRQRLHDLPKWRQRLASRGVGLPSPPFFMSKSRSLQREATKLPPPHPSSQHSISARSIFLP